MDTPDEILGKVKEYRMARGEGTQRKQNKEKSMLELKKLKKH